jgi:hypothetical protein
MQCSEEFSKDSCGSLGEIYGFEMVASQNRVTPPRSKKMWGRNSLKRLRIWLAALDDFRNWLIREAA